MAVLQWFRKGRSRALAGALVGACLAVSLAACDGEQGRRQGQADSRRPAAARGGRRGSRAEDGADLQRVRGADRRQGNGGDPRPGAGLPGRRSTSPRARSSRRASCCSPSTSASTRRSCCRPRPSSKPRMARLGKAETDERRLKPLAERKAVPQQDYDNAAANLLTAKAGVSAAKASVAEAELEPELHHDPLADHGPDRQTPGGPRQPGRQERGHAAGHRVEHRSDPRQCHPQRSGVPALLCQPEGASERCPRALELMLADGSVYPVQGQVRPRRSGGGPEDRHAEFRRRVPEPARAAAPRAVRPRARRRRNGQGRDADSEARGPGDPGHEERARGRRRQHGRAAHHPAGRNGRRPADRPRRPEAR